MIIFIHGEDTFRSRKYLQEQITEFKKKRDPSGLNVCLLDGKTEKADKIFTEITAAPFLAERRLVVIKNILNNKDENLLEKISEAIKNKTLPEVNVIIFFQEEEKGKNKIVQELFSLLSQQQYVYEKNFLTEKEIRGWVEKEIKVRGGKISLSAVGAIVKATGNDSWLLNSLLDQLIAYKDGEEITTEDINLFVEEKTEDNIFALTEAVAYGEKNKAFKMIEEQRKNGIDDGYIFSMILRQFRILTQAADILKKNPHLGAEAVAKEIKQKPFVIKKVWSLLQKDYQWFVRVYDFLLDMDLKVKTGVADQETLLDFLVEKI